MPSRPRKFDSTAGDLPWRPTAAWRYTAGRLPPLPGQRWVEQEGIAVPAGWTWTPAVEAALVRQVFGLAAGDVALWHADGAWERIAGDEFVRATRAAVEGNRWNRLGLE